MCTQREKSAGKSSQVPRTGKSFSKAVQAVEAQTSAIVVDRSVIDDLIALVETRIAASVANVVISAKCVDLLLGMKMLGLLRWNSLSPRRREIQHVWALSISVCDNSDLPSDESGNLLNMIMDSGSEEHVVSLADWKSLGEPVLKPAQVRLRSATGDDMGVSGSFVVRGWCDNQMEELTAELPGLCGQQRSW